jgi:hypothetical protein
MKYSLRSLMPKRSWFQFSLKTLFIATALASLPLCWWNHRSFCQHQARAHAQKNRDSIGKMFPGYPGQRPNPKPIFYSYQYGTPPQQCHYHLMRNPVPADYETYSIEADEGELPPNIRDVQAEMQHELQLLSKYRRAIMLPWERLWIEDAP